MSYSESQLALKAHIEAINAQYGLSVDTDLDYWAGHEIISIAQYEHSEAVTDYVETVKEDCGFKPRHIDFSQYSTEQLREMTNDIRYREERHEQRMAEVRARNVIAPNRPFANLKNMINQE